MARTASLKTSLPFIRITRLGSAGSKEKVAPGICSNSAVPATVCSRDARMAEPGRLDAPSTTAPAPSPNSTQVVRSSQSRTDDSRSAPMTQAWRYRPEESIAQATSKAYRKPVQAALRSKHAAPEGMPSFCWTRQAVAGMARSGVTVARMSRSTS